MFWILFLPPAIAVVLLSCIAFFFTDESCLPHSGAYSNNLPEVIAYENAKRELREKKRLATLNIIADMELGGTKAELMEKLSNLQF